MPSPEFSLIVPAYNEAANLPALFSEIRTAMSNGSRSYEVLVVDDRSGDATAAIAKKEPGIRLLPKRGPRGKAFSILEGIAAARGTYLGFIDADLQYPPAAIPEMLARLDAGAGIVVADRAEKHTALTRRFASGAFRLIFGRMLLGTMADVQSGLKVFQRRVLEEMVGEPTAWSLDAMLVLAAKRAGERVESVPIIFSERTAGQSQINAVSVALELAAATVRLRLAAFRHDLAAR